MLRGLVPPGKPQLLRGRRLHFLNVVELQDFFKVLFDQIICFLGFLVPTSVAQLRLT